MTGDVAPAMTAERATLLFAELAAYKAEGEERGIPEVVAELHAGQGWKALGYDTFDAACDAILGGWRLRLPRGERREMVGELRDAGLSTRAIGSALGVDHATVVRDIGSGGADAPPNDYRTVAGLDGKTYPTTRPKTADDVPDSEPLEVLANLGASPALQRQVAVTQYPQLDVAGATDEQIIRIADALNRVPDEEREMRLANGVKWLESRSSAPTATADPLAPADKVIAAVNATAITLARSGGPAAFDAAWLLADEFTREQWRASIDSLTSSLNELSSITHTTAIRRIK